MRDEQRALVGHALACERGDGRRSKPRKRALRAPLAALLCLAKRDRQQRDREAMTAAASASRTVEKTGQPNLDRCQDAVAAAERLLHLARAGVRKTVEAAGAIDAAQASAHGLAW